MDVRGINGVHGHGYSNKASALNKRNVKWGRLPGFIRLKYLKIRF